MYKILIIEDDGGLSKAMKNSSQLGDTTPNAFTICKISYPNFWNLTPTSYLSI